VEGGVVEVCQNFELRPLQEYIEDENPIQVLTQLQLALTPYHACPMNLPPLYAQFYAELQCLSGDVNEEIRDYCLISEKAQKLNQLAGKIQFARPLDE
jgi:hypothetical protein